MQKTSFRLPEEIMQALAQIADKSYQGNRTAALVAAVQYYQESLFREPAAGVGWLSVRLNGKVRCSACNNPIEGQGFVRLMSDGCITTKLHCSKCAK